MQDEDHFDTSLAENADFCLVILPLKFSRNSMSNADILNKYEVAMDLGD